MGRKRRGGRQRFYEVRQGQQAVRPKPRLAKLAERLERPGQREQFINNLYEVSPAGFPGSPLRAWTLPTPRRQGYERLLTAQPQTPKRLFHGTPRFNVAHIALRSLRLPRGAGMFGPGIYTTPHIDKALGFTGYGKEERYVFVAMVLLGRIYEAPAANRNLNLSALEGMGFDSVCGRRGKTASWKGCTLAYTEYVVYDPNRVLLTHLLEYPPP